MNGRVSRGVLGILVNALLVVAILLAGRLVVEFFGQLKVQGWAQALILVTNYMVIPLGFSGIKTPYGGTFDVNAAVTAVIVLVAETVLSAIRDRV
jgi:hypothetical protein